MSNPNDSDDRRSYRHARRLERWGGAPIGAIILLIVGGVLLAQNLGANVPERWWAFLFLIPATGAVIAATRHYRETGAMSSDFVSSLLSAAIFAVLWAAFYFEFGWSIFWPVLLIVIGIALLVRDYWPRGDNEPR